MFIRHIALVFDTAVKASISMVAIHFCPSPLRPRVSRRSLSARIAINLDKRLTGRQPSHAAARPQATWAQPQLDERRPNEIHTHSSEKTREIVLICKRLVTAAGRPQIRRAYGEILLASLRFPTSPIKTESAEVRHLRKVS
jgi:hypothetical protein